MLDIVWSLFRIVSPLVVTACVGLQFKYAWKPFDPVQGPKWLHSLLLASGLTILCSGGWLVIDQIPQFNNSRAAQISETLAELKVELKEPNNRVEKLVELTEARTARSKVYDSFIGSIALLCVWVVGFHFMIVRPKKQNERIRRKNKVEELLL